MLRDRDQSALARSQRWLAPLNALCCRHRRARLALRNTVVFDTAVTRDSDGGHESDLEWCERGRAGLEFTRAVVGVVEIEEEGLFRNIVTYL